MLAGQSPVQSHLSIPDTLGPSKTVLISEVHNHLYCSHCSGTTVNCPHYRGVLISVCIIAGLTVMVYSVSAIAYYCSRR